MIKKLISIVLFFILITSFVYFFPGIKKSNSVQEGVFNLTKANSEVNNRGIDDAYIRDDIYTFTEKNIPCSTCKEKNSDKVEYETSIEECDIQSTMQEKFSIEAFVDKITVFLQCSDSSCYQLANAYLVSHGCNFLTDNIEWVELN